MISRCSRRTASPRGQGLETLRGSTIILGMVMALGVLTAVAMLLSHISDVS
jgi:hypothetical protein